MAKKHCKECDNPIWARGYCLQHDKQYNSHKYEIKRKEAVKSKDNTNQSNLPAKPKSVLKRIKSVSDKKLIELAEYRVVRDKYLSEHPICEFHTCDCRVIELHHMAGRIGKLLTNPKYFKSLCREHHNYVELHPVEAKEMGLSIDRLSIP
jgi:hypothetical protein